MDDLDEIDTLDSDDLDEIDALDSDDLDEGIDFLDTSDIDNSILDEAQGEDITADDEPDDDLYHAVRMSDEEVSRIDDMWDDTSDKKFDVEPYKATSFALDQSEDLEEPYRATHLSDAADVPDAVSDQDDVAEADISPSLEEQFATDVEAMSSDDIAEEQAHLDALSQLNDTEIRAEFVSWQEPGYDPDLFDAMTDGLSRDELECLKEGLETGNPDVYAYFGLSDTTDAGEDTSSARVRHR